MTRGMTASAHAPATGPQTFSSCCSVANGYNAAQFAGGNMRQHSGQFDAQSRLTAGGAAVSFGHRPDLKKAP